MSLAFLLDCGGSSYLPEELVAEYLKTGRLFKVSDAPIIDRRVYAVYQAQGERHGIVEEALGYLKGDELPQQVHSSSVR